MNFYTLVMNSIDEMQTEARANKNTWIVRTLKSEQTGKIVKVEYISGVNEAFKVNDSGATCMHWPNANMVAAIMTAAGYKSMR